MFCDLFEKRKYALQLYQTIHPEDTDVTEDDIGDVTINNVFTDQEYNDLGMTVRGKLLLMSISKPQSRKGMGAKN